MNLKLDQFLKKSQFAKKILIQTDPVKEISGIFDNAFIDATTGEMDLDTTLPRFVCKSEDLNQVTRETVVIIDSVNYSILDLRPDGTGMTSVILAHEA